MSPSRLQSVLEAGKFAVTAEAGPPRGPDAEVVRRKARLLKGSVDACNVTDNQTSVVRMASMAACRILSEEGVEPVMQMVCRDRNRIAAQSDILGAAALGIPNLLCLTGDHQSFGDHPQAKNVFDLDSIQLVKIAREMRDASRFAGGKALEGKLELFIGASANPFADPAKIQVPRLAKKVAAGSEFIQTQCVFNIAKFKEWMKGVRERGLDAATHILAGITPARSAAMLEYMATHVAGMDVPEAVIARVKGVPKARQAEEGIRIAVETVRQLREIPGVRGVHIMAIEWEESVPEIVKQAGVR